MKRVLAFLCLAVMLLSLAGAAGAHSGRTDKYGCHTDSKTGVRH